MMVFETGDSLMVVILLLRQMDVMLHQQCYVPY